MYLGTFMFFDFKIKVPEGQRLLSVCKSLTAVRCWIYCTECFLEYSVEACMYSSQVLYRLI